MARRFDCRRVKLHRSYTIAELSALVGAHKHTIGRWIAAGLQTMDAKRLAAHPWRRLPRVHECARTRSSSAAEPGEIYCLGCRAPKRPALNMADYSPRTVLRGIAERHLSRLRAMIYRATTLAKLDARSRVDSKSHFRMRSNA